MRLLVVSSSSDLPDLVEQAALAGDIGPFEVDAVASAPEDEGSLVAYDALVVEHAPPPAGGGAAPQRGRGLARDQVPVVVVLGAGAEALKPCALAAGAADVLARPFTALELERRVGNVLRQKAFKRALDDKERWIEAQVAKVRHELESRQEEIILRLCRAGDYRDHETGEHIIRMARYCQLIAEELGFPPETCQFIYSAAQMHDIGKIGIPDAILQKPGKLTPEERGVMQEHTLIGESILQGSSSPLIQAAEIIAATHHERWDGEGYPRGLKGESIPVSGRIAAVADVFDALTSERHYKLGWPVSAARDEIVRNRGTQFDPACVDAFLRRWEDVLAIAHSAGNGALAQRLQGLRAGSGAPPVSSISHCIVAASPPATGMNSTIGVS
jgi:putative two-component system response regulator